MVYLSDIMEKDVPMPTGFGFVFFGEMAGLCLEEDEAENKIMEGLCPERIKLNDDWFEGITEIDIEYKNKTNNAFAYYPPEYLLGKPWTTACTSFAIFSIAYKLLTKELPYIGNIPDELLSSNEGKKLIRKRRKDDNLNLSSIPSAFRNFFAKGLSLKKKERYDAIGDTAEEFSFLCDVVKLEELLPHESNTPSTDEPSQSDLEKLLAQNTANDFMLEVRRDDTGNLDDLVGLDELKYYLRHRVIAILKNPEKAKRYKLQLPNALLLYGPPGCGKSAVAQKFAAECRMNYAIICAKDIASTLVHGVQRIVGQLFQQAAAHAPIILIFEEIDSMLPDRNNPDNRKVAEDTNGFLPELSTCAERGIFVIGTTNRPQLIDSAALRAGRFDQKFYVPLPDEKTRTLIFHNYLHDRPIAKHIDYQQLGKMTSSGYISSDIRKICDDVAARAFDDDTIITQALIEQVIRDGGPSISRRELKTFEDTRRFIEPESKCGAYINRIGFN